MNVRYIVCYMISNTYYDVGDELVVNVVESAGGKDTYKREVKTKIIGRSYESGEDFYLCYVPCYEFHPSAKKIDNKTLRRFQAPDSYLNEKGFVVNAWTDVSKHIVGRQGIICDVCHEFIDYAQADTYGEFTCWACKEDPYRRSF